MKYLIFRRRRIYISDLDLMFQFWPKNFKTFKKSVATIIQKNPNFVQQKFGVNLFLEI